MNWVARGEWGADDSAAAIRFWWGGVAAGMQNAADSGEESAAF